MTRPARFVVTPRNVVIHPSRGVTPQDRPHHVLQDVHTCTFGPSGPNPSTPSYPAPTHRKVESARRSMWPSSSDHLSFRTSLLWQPVSSRRRLSPGAGAGDVKIPARSQRTPGGAAWARRDSSDSVDSRRRFWDRRRASEVTERRARCKRATPRSTHRAPALHRYRCARDGVTYITTYRRIRSIRYRYSVPSGGMPGIQGDGVRDDLLPRTHRAVLLFVAVPHRRGQYSQRGSPRAWAHAGRCDRHTRCPSGSGAGASAGELRTRLGAPAERSREPTQHRRDTRCAPRVTAERDAGRPRCHSNPLRQLAVALGIPTGRQVGIRGVSSVYQVSIHSIQT